MPVGSHFVPCTGHWDHGAWGKQETSPALAMLRGPGFPLVPASVATDFLGLSNTRVQPQDSPVSANSLEIGSFLPGLLISLTPYNTEVYLCYC